MPLPTGPLVVLLLDEVVVLVAEAEVVIPVWLTVEVLDVVEEVVVRVEDEDALVVTAPGMHW